MDCAGWYPLPARNVRRRHALRNRSARLLPLETYRGHGIPGGVRVLHGERNSVAASLTSRPDGYLVRRIKRIYPTYLAALALAILTLLPHPLHLPQGQVLVLSDWKTILANVFMMQGTLVPSILADGPVWTLSIEWWCYIAAILLIRWSNWITKLLIGLSFASLMVYVGSRGYLVGDHNMTLGLGLPVLARAWLTGFSYYREPTKANFAILILLPLIMFEVGPRMSLASVVIAASALAVYFSKSVCIKSRKVEQIIRWLGDMSYPLYLFHVPLRWWISSETPLKNGNALIVVVLAIVSVAYYFGCLLMNWVKTAISPENSRSTQATL